MPSYSPENKTLIFTLGKEISKAPIVASLKFFVSQSANAPTSRSAESLIQRIDRAKGEIALDRSDFDLIITAARTFKKSLQSTVNLNTSAKGDLRVALLNQLENGISSYRDQLDFSTTSSQLSKKFFKDPPPKQELVDYLTVAKGFSAGRITSKDSYLAIFAIAVMLTKEFPFVLDVPTNFVHLTYPYAGELRSKNGDNLVIDFPGFGDQSVPKDEVAQGAILAHALQVFHQFQGPFHLLDALRAPLRARNN